MWWHKMFLLNKVFCSGLAGVTPGCRVRSVLKVTEGKTKFPKTTPAYSEEAEQWDLLELCLIFHLCTKPRWQIQTRTMRIDPWTSFKAPAARLSRLSVKSLIVLENKRAPFVQTQEAGASHSPAETVQKVPSISVSPSACLSVRLSPIQTNKQSSMFSGDRKTELQTAKADILTPTVRWEQKRAEQRKRPSLLGVKLCLLWTWLTLWGHWQSTVMGETALLADFTLTSSAPAPESQIPRPPLTCWYLHKRGSTEQRSR